MKSMFMESLHVATASPPPRRLTFFLSIPDSLVERVPYPQPGWSISWFVDVK
jgi:hypothetical protein